MVALGEDNPSNQCIVGTVPFLWDGKLTDHIGPYDNVTMGVPGCIDYSVV